MKIKKITEDFENDLETTFYFLNSVSLSSSPVEYINFLKSLNLTSEQYVKIAEIMENFGSERYEDGKQDGIDTMNSWGDSSY